MKVIYDIRTGMRTPLIQSMIKEGRSGFRTKWGLYGTEEWLDNLKNHDLIETLEGNISKLLMAGHNDFPVFEIDDGKQKFQFERLGLEENYQVGKKIKVQAIKAMYINPISGFENSLTPIIIEIEE